MKTRLFCGSFVQSVRLWLSSSHVFTIPEFFFHEFYFYFISGLQSVFFCYNNYLVISAFSIAIENFYLLEKRKKYNFMKKMQIHRLFCIEGFVEVLSRVSDYGQAHYMFSRFLNPPIYDFFFMKFSLLCFSKRQKFSIVIKKADITVYYNRKRHFIL